MSTIVEARDLFKRYGSLTAVDRVHFEVESGECFGLLGPNGAGKTSAMRMISCVSPISSGELLVTGLNVRYKSRLIKSRIGVVPQEENLDSELTVIQNLISYGRYFDLSPKITLNRALEGLELFQLRDRSTSPIDTLSGGMKRRLLIVRAMLHNPQILLLDEPTTGLDPQGRRLMWQKLRYLQSQGTTLIISTHYMEEAQNLCNQVAIMDQGSILAKGKPQELVERHIGSTVLEIRPPLERWHQTLTQLREFGFQLEETLDAICLYNVGGPDFQLEYPGIFGQASHRPGTLEDVFLHLTGRGLSE
jgi:lipooligosaccharide transport system ATP-binding protein